MTWLFASGRSVDIVLLVIVIELLWMVTRGGWRVRDALLRLGPGALMLIALRSALIGLQWPWIALPLLLSFPVHLADLAWSTAARRSVPPGQ